MRNGFALLAFVLLSSCTNLARTTSNSSGAFGPVTRTQVVKSLPATDDGKCHVRFAVIEGYWVFSGNAATHPHPFLSFDEASRFESSLDAGHVCSANSEACSVTFNRGTYWILNAHTAFEVRGSATAESAATELLAMSTVSTDVPVALCTPAVAVKCKVVFEKQAGTYWVQRLDDVGRYQKFHSTGYATPQEAAAFLAELTDIQFCL